VATVHRGVRGSGGRIRGLGKRVISRHPSPALRGHLETVPEHTATIKLPERKEESQSFRFMSSLT
jgi:hypothetical protein